MFFKTPFFDLIFPFWKILEHSAFSEKNRWFHVILREFDESKFIQFPHCFYIFAQNILLKGQSMFNCQTFLSEFGEDNCYSKIAQKFQKYLPKFGVDSSAIYCEFFHLEYGQSCNKEKVRNITSVHDDRFSVNVWNSSQVSNEVVSVHKWRDAIQSYTLFRPVSSSENMNRIYKWLESCVLISESVFHQKIHSNQF